MRLVFVLSSLALVACRTGLDLPISGDGGDTTDCSQWTDATSCDAHGCASLDCSFCGSTSSFRSCYDPRDGAPSCPAISCPARPPCNAQNEANCVAESGCFAVYQESACDCIGTDCCPMVFDSCSVGPPVCDPGPTAQPCSPGPACGSGYVPVYPTGGGCAIGCVEATVCSPVSNCTSISTQADCDAASDCYSVVQPELCNCEGDGCCPPQFLSCQAGPALCSSGTPPPPSCPISAQCTIPYAVAYNSQGCPLGCVNESQCAGPD
jgi:hypothetical protein